MGGGWPRLCRRASTPVQYSALRRAAARGLTSGETFQPDGADARVSGRTLSAMNDSERPGLEPNRPQGQVPDAASPLRWIMATATGGSYEFFESLDEAKAEPDGVLVMEGDDGGTIYLVVPARDVKCSPLELERLLIEIDEAIWPGAYPHGRRLVYERAPAGTGIAGGDGGGASTGSLWIHPRVVAKGLEALIRRILG